MAREVNPVDAHRKAEKSKQLKKQKADRKKDADSKDKVDKQKADAARQERRRQELESREAALAKGRKIRNPTRSIYYDEKFNPYGNPPPGMPYLEYPTKAELEQIRKREEEQTTDDLAIALPSDPAPEWANIFSNTGVESEEEEMETILVATASLKRPASLLKPAPPGSAVISSAPVLRDFQQELKQFVPTKLRKKGAESKVEDVEDSEESRPEAEESRPLLEEDLDDDMDAKDSDTDTAPRASMFSSLPVPRSRQDDVALPAVPTVPAAPAAPLAKLLDYSESEDEEDTDTAMQEAPIEPEAEPEPEPDPEYDQFDKEVKGLK